MGSQIHTCLGAKRAKKTHHLSMPRPVTSAFAHRSSQIYTFPGTMALRSSASSRRVIMGSTLRATA